MNSKQFTLRSLGSLIGILGCVVALNYVLDPYAFYGHEIVDIPKTRQADQLRLSKVIRLEEIKPKSVVLGTSRAEFGYDPEHTYLKKPSYNLSVGGSSVYEAKLYLQHAIRMGNLKQVVFVADYIMFNSNLEKRVPDFEEYFEKKDLGKYLYSYKTTKSSFYTLMGERQDKYTIYLDNGQREHSHNTRNIRKFGGLDRKLRAMTSYYSGYDNSDHYRDSGNSSFDDYAELLQMSYENDIELAVVFGPNHALHWESLDYYIGIDKWNQWKRKILAVTQNVGDTYGKPHYPVYDFSVYNEYTIERLPTRKGDLMRYHWEFVHYRTELGDLVMDRLSGIENDFGIHLNTADLDLHFSNQNTQRFKYLKVDEYRENVLVGFRRSNLGQYIRRDPDDS